MCYENRLEDAMREAMVAYEHGESVEHATKMIVQETGIDTAAANEIVHEVYGNTVFCTSCGHKILTDDEDMLVMQLCSDCLYAVSDIMPFDAYDQIYNQGVYCNCEDRPCCGCN